MFKSKANKCLKKLVNFDWWDSDFRIGDFDFKFLKSKLKSNLISNLENKLVGLILISYVNIFLKIILN